MKKENNHIIAGEGKVFRRISDGEIVGKEIWLGVRYYGKGGKLDKPVTELPEHYEEVDKPIEDKIILDEDTILEESTVIEGEESTKEPETVPRRITVSDYVALEKKVEILMRLINEKSDLIAI